MKFRVRTLTPKMVRLNEMYQPLVDVVRQWGPDMEQDLERITRTWDHKPKFDVRTHATLSRNRLDVTVETDDQRFVWVSEGTKDHYVPKSGVATMAFRPYRAKTRVLFIGSQSGGRYGRTIIRRGRWKVRGIKARKYDEALARRWQPIIERRALDGMTSAALASGFSGI